MLNFFKNPNNEENTMNTLKIIEDRKDKNLPIYNFGIGDDPFPVIKEIKDEITKNLDIKDYHPPNGKKELRNWMFDRFKDQDYKPNNILFGNGIKQLLFILQQVYEGEIIIFTPCRLFYRKQSEILNKQFHLFELKYEDNYKIDFDKLQEWIFNLKKGNLNKKYLLIFNNPCNPTGIIHSEHDVLRLAAICKHNNILVFEDYSYSSLEHGVRRTVSISEYYPEMTIRGNSISKKYGLSGYRLGWCFFPPKIEYIYKQMIKIAWATYSCPSVPILNSLKFIKSNSKVRYHKLQRKYIYKLIGEQCYNILSKKTQLLLVKPEATWHMFLDFSNYKIKLNKIGIYTSKDLVYQLINDIGFVSVPGISFSSEKMTIRFSYTDLNKNLINDKFKSIYIIPLLQTYLFTKILDGLNVLINWLDKL